MRGDGGGGAAAREGQMDLAVRAVLVLGGLWAAVLAVRAAAAREGFTRAAVNGLLGLAALLIVNFSYEFTGLRLGFNVFNGVTAGILGIPGVVLLLLVQWVLGSS